MANDNFLFTSWPYLGGGTSCYGGPGAWNGCTNPVNGSLGGGISYTTFPNSTASVAGPQAFININGDPVNEYPLHSQDGNNGTGGVTPSPYVTGPTFFMYWNLGDTTSATSCIPPTAGQATYASTLYSFSYQSSPGTQTALNPGGVIWSSCASGTWQLLGPFNVPLAVGTVTPQYALVAVSGQRTFAQGTTVQTVNFTTPNGFDGGDFRIYANAVPVDGAGITFGTTAVGYFADGAGHIDVENSENYINSQ